MAAQIQALDEQVGRITTALRNKGIIENTIIVFMSDNGASTRIPSGISGINYGSNWPLRQAKGTLFDGGVRTPAFIWSPLIKRRGGLITNQLTHVVDWFPTLYEAAGGNPVDLGNIDGVSHWQSFVAGKKVGARKEVPCFVRYRRRHYTR